MLDNKELRKNVNSVNVGYLSLKRKEAKTLTQYIDTDEKPILFCRSTEGKIILTRENLFIITSKLFRTPKVKVIPLSSIKNIQEKRGMLLANITFSTADSTVKIKSLDKKASTIIMNSLKDSENIEVLPTKKPSILESTFKLAVIAIFAFVIKDAFHGSIENKKTDQNQPAENSTEYKVFNPVYKIIEEDNLTIFGVPRFEQRISVPLGLSVVELKQNIRTAAWTLLKNKNAVAVTVFAFREDDKKREGGYTAGKCTIAPNGNWADAVEVRKPVNLKEEIIISEAYNDNTPIRPNGSKAFIKKGNMLPAYMHKIDAKQNYTDDVLTELRAGTEVTILESQRIFSMYGPTDLYKVG